MQNFSSAFIDGIERLSLKDVSKHLLLLIIVEIDSIFNFLASKLALTPVHFLIKFCNLHLKLIQHTIKHIKKHLLSEKQ